jgi:ribonuclease HIII
MNTYSTKLSPKQQDALTQHLQSGTYELFDVAYAKIAGKQPHLNVVLYNSGKLVVQGKGTKEWIEFVWEPLFGISSLSSPPSDSKPSPENASAPIEHIGIDESGKGDFFGPMVVAAFLMKPEDLELLATLGARDSKEIKSEAKINRIAEALLKKMPHQCEILVLKPETYNPLVKKMGSVNRLLAWGHATVLENLLERYPNVTHATADQFGPEHQITTALKTRGKQITLEQRHKAESDPAVAAASILARHRFVLEMNELSKLCACTLPRGATHVRSIGEDIVKRAGPDILTRVAKTHFRTTRQVLEACGHPADLLGTPEPKKFNPYKKSSGKK